MKVGQRHICVLLNGGDVQCWGSNDWGQLGNGLLEDFSARAQRVTALSNARALAIGYSTTCALTKTDETYCWGHNGTGGIGDYSAVPWPTVVDGF